MPITLFQLNENMIGEVNTHQGGHMKPNRNLTQWANTISKDIYNDLIEEFEKTRVISNKLQPFLKIKNIFFNSIAHQMWDAIKLPPDYNYFASAVVVRKGKEQEPCGCKIYDTIDGNTGLEGSCKTYIDEDELNAAQLQADDNLKEFNISLVKTNEWNGVVNHVNLGPTHNAPKCTQYDGGLQIAPKRLGVIILKYFRKPLESTFDYTIINPDTEDEYYQYNASTSQVLEWDDKLIPEFMARLKEKYGVLVREPMITKAGQDNIKII